MVFSKLDVLATRRGLSSIHLISHGAPGKIFLGKAELSLETLGIYSEQIQQWSESLGDRAELLIYGCEVAKGDRGEQLIHLLSELTGAAVAASSTKVGNSTLGGSWKLDVATGTITSILAFSRSILESYPATLNEFRVNTYTTDPQIYSTVTALSGGGFVVTWSSYLQDRSGYGSGYGIYGQRYDATGTAVGSEFRINTYTINNQLYSSVTALSDGGFVVTWSFNLQDGSGNGIYGQRYNATGTAVGSEFRINTYTINNQLYSSVTALSDGGFVVTWSSDGQDGSGYGIYGQRYDATGTAVGSEFRINQLTAGNQWNETYANGAYSIDQLANGNLVVTWYGMGLGDNSGVFARILTFVNNAPALTDAKASLIPGLEDTNYIITSTSLLQGYSDVDSDALAVANLIATNGTLVNNYNGTWTFTPTANFNGTVDLTYSVVDSNGGSLAASQFFSIAAVNDAPILDLNGSELGIGFTATFTEDADAVSIVSPGLTLTDVDSAQVNSAIIRITNLQDPGFEFLTLRG